MYDANKLIRLEGIPLFKLPVDLDIRINAVKAGIKPRAATQYRLFPANQMCNGLSLGGNQSSG